MVAPLRKFYAKRLMRSASGADKPVSSPAETQGELGVLRSESITDEEFSAAVAKQGDEWPAGAAWEYEEMDRRFRAPILNYAFRQLGNRETAEEITQEVLLKAYRFRDSYDPSRGFSAWLWTIARNTLIDWKRKAAHQHGDLLAASPDTEGRDPSIEHFPCLRPNAEAVVLDKMQRKQFFGAFRKLTRLQRKVVWLRFFRQLPYQEIAKQLSVSLSAVKCAAYRGKLALVPLVSWISHHN